MAAAKDLVILSNEGRAEHNQSWCGHKQLKAAWDFSDKPYGEGFEDFEISL